MWDKLKNSSQSKRARRGSSDSIDLELLQSPTGRVSLRSLRAIAEESSPEQFRAFFRVPALVGKTIQSGDIEKAAGSRQKTLLFFRAKEILDATRQYEALCDSVYPLLKSGRAKTEYAAGYVIGCKVGADIIMPDFAISKKHAVITVRNKAYHIKDLGSTNGTSINGNPIGSKELPLADQQIIGLGRYEFFFLTPESLYLKLTGEL